MKVYVHKETNSIARDVERWGTAYEEVEFARDYSEYLILRVDRFEVHRASTTVWFEELHYNKGTDSYSADVNPRLFPMRIDEFQRLLKEGYNMLHLTGHFGFSKQGTAVGIVRHGG